MESVLYLSVISLLSLLSCVPYAMTGFGNAITYHLMWYLCSLLPLGLSGSVVEAAVHLALMLPPMACAQMLYCWKKIDWKLAGLLGVSQAPTAALLTFFVADLNRMGGAEELREGLGVVLCLVAVWQLWVDFLREDDETSEEGKLGALKPSGDVEAQISSSPPPAVVGCPAPPRLNSVESWETTNGSSPREQSKEEVEEEEGSPRSSSDGSNAVAEDVHVFPLGNPARLESDLSCSSASFSVTTPSTLRLALLCGLTSGACTGLFSLGGPPLMVFVLVTKPNPDVWRASACASQVFNVALFRGPSLIASGLLEGQGMEVVAALWLGVGLGLGIGNKMMGKVDKEVTRKLILLFLFISAPMMCSLKTFLVTCGSLITLWIIGRLVVRCRARSQRDVIVEKE